MNGPLPPGPAIRAAFSLQATGEARRVREAAGLSTRELAARVGVRAYRLSSWEALTFLPDERTAPMFVATIRELRGQYQ